MGRRLHHDNKVTLRQELPQRLSRLASLGIIETSMRRLILFLSITVLYLPLVRAQTSLRGILINADTSEHDTRRKVVILKGHVQVVFKGNHLRADAAEIDLISKQVRAFGQITLDNAKAHLEGKSLIMNYETVTGVLMDGFVRSGTVSFEGEMIEKTGPDEYIAHNARYTACTDCPPDWSFSGSRIKATLGGYADIRYPVLRVRGVPVFISPWLLVPLKSSRQSGFLVPALEFPAGNVSFEIPFFWAIDRNQDLTITAKQYDKRGYKLLLDHRYVLTQDSSGWMRSAFIRDKAFIHANVGTIDRWFLAYHHYYALPENYVHRINLNAASDLRYQTDFPLEMAGNGDAALENRMSLSKTTENSVSSAEADVFINLLKSDPLGGNQDSVHRLPELRYGYTRTRLGDSPFVFNLDMTYTNFFRPGYSYDSWVDSATYCLPPNSGRGCILHGADFKSQDTLPNFNSNKDFIRTGQRLLVSPRVSVPFRLFQALDFNPSISYNEAQYAFNIDSSTSNSSASDTAARRYIQADLNLRTRFTRVFQTDDTDSNHRIKHIIQPSITYSLIPWIRQPNQRNFFGDTNQPYARTLEPVSDSDVVGSTRIQFDNYDRVYDKRLLDFGVTNYLNFGNTYGSESRYRNVVAWRLSQSYDLNQRDSGLRQPLSALNSIMDVRFDRFQTYTINSYYPYAKIINTSSRVRFSDERGDFLELSYVRKFLIDLNNNVDVGNKIETAGFNIGYVGRQFTIAGGLNYNLSKEPYVIQSWQYTAIYRPYGGCWSVQIGHHQVIGGQSQLRFNFAFDFGGKQASAPTVMPVM